MRKSNCYHCGYFRERRSDGSIYNYCSDRDCIVDPYEPECDYE